MNLSVFELTQNKRRCVSFFKQQEAGQNKFNYKNKSSDVLKIKPLN